MMNALQPQSVEQTCVNYSKPGAKGDGIKACRVGCAIMDTTHTSIIFDRGGHQARPTGEYGESQRWCPLLDGQPAVLEGEPEG